MPPEQSTVLVELGDPRPVLVGDVEGAVGGDADPLGIEAEALPRLGSVERAGVADEALAMLVAQQPRVEQPGRDVRERRADVGLDPKEVDPIEVGDIGQAVERPAIRCGDEHVVVAGIGDRRPEPAEDGGRDAVRRVAGLADLAVEPGLVETRGRHQSLADQFDPRGRRE